MNTSCLCNWIIIESSINTLYCFFSSFKILLPCNLIWFEVEVKGFRTVKKKTYFLNRFFFNFIQFECLFCTWKFVNISWKSLFAKGQQKCNVKCTNGSPTLRQTFHFINFFANSQRSKNLFTDVKQNYNTSIFTIKLN